MNRRNSCKTNYWIAKKSRTVPKSATSPHRGETYTCLSLDANDFVYMDERLITPKALRPLSPIMRSLPYGHPGRDAMLATISNVLWPRLHREVVTIARECPQCKKSGKNVKTLLRQKQIGKILESK